MRYIIQKSGLSNQELSKKYDISVATVIKWKNRDYTNDLSSKPKKIYYALDNITKELIRVVRELTWMPLDDLVDVIQSINPKAKKNKHI